ncbi:MAG: zinc ribbon domain-containing protein [Lachnospiraceae bacterium]|nr:zinc ribbon domain-containing protein [Lachnospiraceae bacterium]
MIYCSYCGKQLNDDAVFCRYCGKPIDGASQESEKYSVPVRKSEYAGTIIKCPSCGEVLKSLTAICPSCGHEINSESISDAVKDFSEKIKQLDLLIAASSQPGSENNVRTGWKSWGVWKKIFWVLLNLYTFCIPLLIYFLRPYLGLEKQKGFTQDETRKAAFINHYIFPNTRETILEALLYIKGQVSQCASDKRNGKSLQWITIWKNKADQLYQNAEALFPGDPIAADAYSSILRESQEAKHALLYKIIFVGFLVLLALCLFIFVFYIPAINRKAEKGTDPGSAVTTGYFLEDDPGFYIPS